MTTDDFFPIYDELLLNDSLRFLPGKSSEDREIIAEDKLKKLLGHASIMASMDEPENYSLAYDILARIAEISGGTSVEILSAVDLLLSRLGNFPGRKLLRDRFGEKIVSRRSFGFDLEKISREAENYVEYSGNKGEILTDFQYSLFGAVTEGESVSVSAPTSAGKSYVLNLAILKRITSENKQSIIYVVPTRALISEVAFRIRSSIKGLGIEGLVVRTAPFPLAKDDVKKGVVYVLTQERLSSLISSIEPGLWVSALIVDEAHEIQKSKRGVVLQNSIDAVLSQFPNIPVLFASPLISNPKYFLDNFNTEESSKAIVERVSPVSQNVILVEKVHRKPRFIKFGLVNSDRVLDLGIREVDFDFRGGLAQIKSNLAISIYRPDESTILFSNGPTDAENMAISISKELSEQSFFTTDLEDELVDFIDFVKSEIHNQYPLIECLRNRVAFHYGNMPSIVRGGIEELFKAGNLKFICCTSTLLQGVNLPAKNIIISNPKSGDKPMSRPDFLNLSGRAGRLLKEFHGNIWCINPTQWDSSIYQGKQLEEIKSAMDSIMEDGGSKIGDLLRKEIKKQDEIEEAEVAYSRLYHEQLEQGRESLETKYGTDKNADVLRKTLDSCEKVEITVPDEILSVNKSLRPDHLNALYVKLSSELFLPALYPHHPFSEGAKRRFEAILGILSQCFEWEIHENYFPFLSYVAYEWVRGTSLKEMLKSRVSYVQSTSSDDSVSKIVRDLLKVIERDIRFKLEKYFSAYSDILRLVAIEKELKEEQQKIEPYHIYLEFGAADKTSLNLMALGLSRFTALKLSKYSILKDIDGDKPEEYFGAIVKISEGSQNNMPRVCIKEIRDLTGDRL